METGQDKPVARQLTDFAQVEALYEERLKKDFVRSELRPLSSMRRSWERGAYDCYGLFDGDEILGYAFFVRLGNNYLLDYLAIAEERRDEGLGSAFLRRLADGMKEANCMVVEVEDPDRAGDAESRAIRERRLQFYLRNGYRDTELRSVVFGVAYRILEVPTAGTYTTGELREVYRELYRSILPGRFFHTQFHI